MSLSPQQISSKLPFFHSLIAEWEASNPPAPALSSTVKSNASREGKDVLVAFRTRPPLEFEFDRFAKEKRDQAAPTTENVPEDGAVEENTPIDAEGMKKDFRSGMSVTSVEPGVMVAHVPGMKWNGPKLTQKTFIGDLAFGPEVGNEEVYQKTVVATDMLNLVLGGGVGCVMAYGQTGAGKTYTISSLESLISTDLFPAAHTFAQRFRSSFPDLSPNDEIPTEKVFAFEVTFLELLGKVARDLVGGEEQGMSGLGKGVDVIEDKAGYVRPRLFSTPITSSEQLKDTITRALEHRRTDATEKNATSSRSHAVLCVRVKNLVLSGSEEGELVLVDLAGSERYDDSKAHSKELMDQSRENNKSLATLKECVRSRAKASCEDGVVHIPFRTNKLTLLLKSIFDLESTRLSKTVVIAHVSPHLQDTAHSVSTLSYAAPFLISAPKHRSPPPYDPLDPRTWDHTQTLRWLTDQQATWARGKRRAAYQVRVNHIKLNTPLVQVKPFDKTNGGKPEKTVIDQKSFCPEGYGGKNLARMYTAEWMECAINAKVEGAKMDEVKDAAMVMYGDFTALLLTARMRTRNEVLKSRKHFNPTDYGEVPAGFKDDTEVEGYEIEWDRDTPQWQRFELVNYVTFHVAVSKAQLEAKDKGEDEKVAAAKVRKIMWDDWYEEVKQKHNKELEVALQSAYRKGKADGKEELEVRAAVQAELKRCMGYWLDDKVVPAI